MTSQIQSYRIVQILVIILLLEMAVGMSFHSGAAAETPPTDLMTQGHQWYQQGNFEQAAESWTQASLKFQESGDHANYIQALIYLSRTLAEMGKKSEGPTPSTDCSQYRSDPR